VKKLLGVALGILSAIGGFVDIGDLVANGLVGSRFGMSLAWATVLGGVGIVLFAEMSGRVAAVSGRPVFDLVRERLGPRAALANLVASLFVNFLTLCAELGGIALALQLATSINHLLWIPVTATFIWIILWRARFSHMENVFGVLGLTMLVFAVALWKLHPDWGLLGHEALHPAVASGEGRPTYFYYAIALFGAAMTPYEVFFFSSGAVEEGWSKRDLFLNRANVLIGFPLGVVLSLAIMACSTTVFMDRGVQVDHLSQVALPVVVALGKLGLVAAIVAFFAATCGAALETALSSGYTVSQYFGWQWGKSVKPFEAARFHTVVLISIILAAFLGLTTIDPIKVTEYSLVFSAVALPLTYFPILVVANDRDYLGDAVNGRVTNALATGFLIIIVVVSAAAIPLMVITKAGM
jgi:manganese transport protein